MISDKKDIIDIVKSKALTYQQKLFNLANISERLLESREILRYTNEEIIHLENHMICDLNEGYAIYRPRYIVADYSTFVKKGCKFLDISAPKNIDELLDGLLILYNHVPSITSFPVYIGNIDTLIDPFITDEQTDYIKIKRFLNHIDKTIVDSFCHANIGPNKTKAGELIIKAILELKNPTPNITLRYNSKVTDKDFALTAVKACLKASKPSFSNENLYHKDMGEHAIVSCYNALPMSGGAYTLLRLRLGTIAKASKTFKEFIEITLPKVTKLMLNMIDKRIKFLVEESSFFETSFLVKESFISRDNFTAMAGIVGLADAVNHFLASEGKAERFGLSSEGDEIAHHIMQTIASNVNSHKGVYVERTKEKYLLHAQVGANLSDEDNYNTPAHRIPIGEEPDLHVHIKQAAQFHKYFVSGTGDLFAFDQTYLGNLDAVLDIINGAMEMNYRYITTYLQNSDLVRVTGYLVKRSEVNKVERGEVVLRDTAILAKGTNDNSKVFQRRIRK